MNFSLTRQEATIYLSLLREGDLNGYEVSKLTGISRSNAYNALASLVEKGAAYKIEGNSVVYTPVNINEFCSNKIRFMQNIKEKLIENIPEKREESSGYITIKGENHIIDKMKNIILSAKERIYISLSQNLLDIVVEELKELAQNKIKIVIITDQKIDFQDAIFYYCNKKSNQIRIIADSKIVLTGDVKDTCLYSSNNNLVEVFKEALTNEIKLIELNKGRDK